MRKLITSIILILIIVALAYYFLHGAQEVSIESFRLTGIDDINAHSFTLNGELRIHNPSRTSIPASAEYDIILKETGEVIGEGTLPEFTLEAQETTKVPFEQEVEWVPTASMLTQLLTQDEVFIVVRGNIHVKRIDLPFEQEQDIKAYLEQYAQSDVTKLLNQ